MSSKRGRFKGRQAKEKAKRERTALGKSILLLRTTMNALPDSPYKVALAKVIAEVDATCHGPATPQYQLMAAKNHCTHKCVEIFFDCNLVKHPNHDKDATCPPLLLRQYLQKEVYAEYEDNPYPPDKLNPCNAMGCYACMRMAYHHLLGLPLEKGDAPCVKSKSKC